MRRLLAIAALVLGTRCCPGKADRIAAAASLAFARQSSAFTGHDSLPDPMPMLAGRRA
jgi:hypothetical protein